MENLPERIREADAGDAQAQYDVAWHMVWEHQKEPLHADWAQRALAYFEGAARQGHGDAMLDLAAMHLEGRGTPRDREKAYYWYHQAALRLHPKAFRCLGYWWREDHDDSGYLEPPAADEHNKEIFDIFFKGAMMEEQNSLYEVGDCFFSGRYVEMDRELAYRLYDRSVYKAHYLSDDSYADACLRLAECHLWAIPDRLDLLQAGLCLREAIESYEIRLERGDPDEFVRPGYNRAVFLKERLDRGETIQEPRHVGPQDSLAPSEEGKAAGDREAEYKRCARIALYRDEGSEQAILALSRMYRQGGQVEKDLAFADYLVSLVINPGAEGVSGDE